MTATSADRVPSRDARDAGHVDILIVGAGYIMRSQDRLFRQGDREPWIHLLDYYEERDVLPAADLDDGTLVYR